MVMAGSGDQVSRAFYLKRASEPPSDPTDDSIKVLEELNAPIELIEATRLQVKQHPQPVKIAISAGDQTIAASR